MEETERLLLFLRSAGRTSKGKMAKVIARRNRSLLFRSGLFTTFSDASLDEKRFFQETLSQCSYGRASANVGGQNLLTSDVIYHMFLTALFSLVLERISYVASAPRCGNHCEPIRPTWPTTACRDGVQAGML